MPSGCAENCPRISLFSPSETNQVWGKQFRWIQRVRIEIGGQSISAHHCPMNVHKLSLSLVPLAAREVEGSRNSESVSETGHKTSIMDTGLFSARTLSDSNHVYASVSVSRLASQAHTTIKFAFQLFSLHWKGPLFFDGLKMKPTQTREEGMGP